MWEVLSESNYPEDTAEKRALYLEVGGEEVWLVSWSGQVRFFKEEEIEQSHRVPAFPHHVKPDVG